MVSADDDQNDGSSSSGSFGRDSKRVLSTEVLAKHDTVETLKRIHESTHRKSPSSSFYRYGSLSPTRESPNFQAGNILRASPLRVIARMDASLMPGAADSPSIPFVPRMPLAPCIHPASSVALAPHSTSPTGDTATFLPIPPPLPPPPPPTPLSSYLPSFGALSVDIEPPSSLSRKAVAFQHWPMTHNKYSGEHSPYFPHSVSDGGGSGAGGSITFDERNGRKKRGDRYSYFRLPIFGGDDSYCEQVAIRTH